MKQVRRTINSESQHSEDNAGNDSEYVPPDDEALSNVGDDNISSRTRSSDKTPTVQDNMPSRTSARLRGRKREHTDTDIKEEPKESAEETPPKKRRRRQYAGHKRRQAKRAKKVVAKAASVARKKTATLQVVTHALPKRKPPKRKPIKCPSLSREI